MVEVPLVSKVPFFGVQFDCRKGVGQAGKNELSTRLAQVPNMEANPPTNVRNDVFARFGTWVKIRPVSPGGN
jgi:hypothetical protein